MLLPVQEVRLLAPNFLSLLLLLLKHVAPNADHLSLLGGLGYQVSNLGEVVRKVPLLGPLAAILKVGMHHALRCLVMCLSLLLVLHFDLLD